MDLLQGLEAFFAIVPLGAGDRIVVAFSGGGDSTALLWALARQAPRWGVAVLAAHLDHGMDDASAARQAHAAGIAGQLGVPFVSGRREVGTHRQAGESLEAAARRLRYEFLEQTRRAAGARYIATAHHREDQAETVLLRLAYGSGLRGLAGIRPVAGTLVRPLLSLPRAALRAAVTRAGLAPVEDPGNSDPRQPRSRMRHQVLPVLAARLDDWDSRPTPDAYTDPQDLDDLTAALARLAAGAARAVATLDRRLAGRIRLPTPGLPAVEIRDLQELPPPLQPHLLALLHRRAGAPYPATRAANDELLRQLRRPHLPSRPGFAPAPAEPQESPSPTHRRHPLGTSDPPHPSGGAPKIACDCGRGWRWSTSGDGALRLRRVPAAAAKTAGMPPFTYTLEVPGVVTVPEIAVTIKVSAAPVEPWMWRGASWRAALAMPAETVAGARWTVRNRRPGDRLRPLGSPGSRKLKEILIDRGVPRLLRDRLPLLCWSGEIAWVPGVTIDHRFRLIGQAPVWLVEIADIGEIAATEDTAATATTAIIATTATPANAANIAEIIEII
jgi:tRNA(Ile)-lysidine synthase